jgi:hypothetical protein
MQFDFKIPYTVFADPVIQHSIVKIRQFFLEKFQIMCDSHPVPHAERIEFCVSLVGNEFMKMTACPLRRLRF